MKRVVVLLVTAAFSLLGLVASDAATTTATTVPAHALVLSVGATPATLGDAGGLARVKGRVEHATSCQLDLLGSQSLAVGYSHNPKPCSGLGVGYAAHVVVGSNPGRQSRMVSFALVARNSTSSSTKRFSVAVAPRPPPRPKATTTPAPTTTVRRTTTTAGPKTAATAVATTVAATTTVPLPAPVVFLPPPSPPPITAPPPITTTVPATTTSSATTTTSGSPTTTAANHVDRSVNHYDGAGNGNDRPDLNDDERATLEGTEQTPNWSGYAVTTGRYIEVTGTFTVPYLTSSATCNEENALWAGIDGFNQVSLPFDSDLIQAGISEGMTNPATGRCSPGTFYVWPWWRSCPLQRP